MLVQPFLIFRTFLWEDTVLWNVVFETIVALIKTAPSTVTFPPNTYPLGLEKYTVKEEHDGSLMIFLGGHSQFRFIYVPNKDVISMDPSMGNNGTRDTGSRKVMLEIRPKPIDIIMLVWCRWDLKCNHVCESFPIFLDDDACFGPILRAQWSTHSFLEEDLVRSFDRSWRKSIFLSDDDCIDDGVGIINVSLLVVVVVLETTNSLWPPTVEKWLFECVEYILGLFLEESLLEFRELDFERKDEDANYLCTIIRDICFLRKRIISIYSCFECGRCVSYPLEFEVGL